MSGDNTKRRENVAPHQPEWQGELDSHLVDLDSRLKQTRRHATQLPEPGGTTPGGPPSADPAEHGLRPGKMLMIRYKMPRLPWPFRLLQRRRRRREHPLTTAKVRV